jgi:hypothetical protein
MGSRFGRFVWFHGRNEFLIELLLHTEIGGECIDGFFPSIYLIGCEGFKVLVFVFFFLPLVEMSVPLGFFIILIGLNTKFFQKMRSL